MIRQLGLGDAYAQSARDLRDRLDRDPRTCLYECGFFDPEGRRLAEEWVARYVK